MARYSEVKEMINLLRANGWVKYKGLVSYRKYWRQGSYQYTQMIMVDELLAFKADAAKILSYHDERAARKIYYAMIEGL